MRKHLEISLIVLSALIVFAGCRETTDVRGPDAPSEAREPGSDTGGNDMGGR